MSQPCQQGCIRLPVHRWSRQTHTQCVIMQADQFGALRAGHDTEIKHNLVSVGAHARP